LTYLKIADAASYTSKDLRNVGARGVVKHVLSGFYVKSGETIRIHADLQEARTGKVVGTEEVEGKGEDSFLPLTDELKRRLKPLLELTRAQIADDIDRNIGQITTSSAEAYKYYLEGRRLHDVGELRKSIEMMEKAVALDLNFAMAYRSMAASYSNMAYWKEARKLI